MTPVRDEPADLASVRAALFSEPLDLPKYMVVRAGALDDPELGRPQRTIWTASAPSWGLTDPAVPRCAEQPGTA